MSWGGCLLLEGGVGDFAFERGGSAPAIPRTIRIQDFGGVEKYLNLTYTTQLTAETYRDTILGLMNVLAGTFIFRTKTIPKQGG